MYDMDKSELENKIPDASDLVKKTDYNTKITEIKSDNLAMILKNFYFFLL